MNKIISLLGLAQKAGKLSSGEVAVEKAVKTGKAKLLLIAADSSEATKKGYKDMAAYYQVPLYETLSKQELGECIGKVQRAAVAVVDAGFSKALIRLLSD
ncbi:MAG: ribosomal L7Ae/L30e/S12e/Gadd45 family protein [Pelosinus sp.]|nr:ribosomal L7Ae/L30e/S12e/Gadd45 family protein [Pelosinus sp.]